MQIIKLVAALRFVRPQFQWYQLAYATEIKSIQLHDSILRLSQKIVSFTLHYITLHYITLHYITLHYITLHYITLHYITLHYITLHYITLHYITLHYITLHYITLHYITLHYITLHYITLHYITLHYITLHYITLHYITLHYITLHYITLHYITLHYITFMGYDIGIFDTWTRTLKPQTNANFYLLCTVVEIIRSIISVRRYPSTSCQLDSPRVMQLDILQCACIVCCACRHACTSHACTHSTADLISRTAVFSGHSRGYSTTSIHCRNTSSTVRLWA